MGCFEEKKATPVKVDYVLEAPKKEKKMKRKALDMESDRVLLQIVEEASGGGEAAVELMEETGRSTGEQRSSNGAMRAAVEHRRSTGLLGCAGFGWSSFWRLRWATMLFRDDRDAAVAVGKENGHDGGWRAEELAGKFEGAQRKSGSEPRLGFVAWLGLKARLRIQLQIWAWT